jgi:hypothetical protein
MSSPVRFLLPVVVVALGLPFGLSGRAQADENLLHGPHPFLKDNELSAHVLLARGAADTPSGTKIALDYGYKLNGGGAPAWLALAFNVQRGTCNQVPTTGSCGLDAGDIYETLAGVRWKFATPLPLVPFVGAAGGLAFAFPNGADAAAGLMVRAVGGANYFFFDWLGIGAEVGYSLGRLDYDATFGGSHTYSVLDLGGGLEFQF